MIFSLLYEYTPHEYVRVPVIYRVYQVEYVLHILVAASQEYVNTYPTRRTAPQGEARRQHVRRLADSEAVLGVWLPAPLPTSRAPPDRGALWPLA